MAINEDVSAIDKHVTKKYEIVQKLGKGVCISQRMGSLAAYFVPRHTASYGRLWIKKPTSP
jgi:hypothetical protein